MFHSWYVTGTAEYRCFLCCFLSVDNWFLSSWCWPNDIVRNTCSLTVSTWAQTFLGFSIPYTATKSPKILRTVLCLACYVFILFRFVLLSLNVFQHCTCVVPIFEATKHVQCWKTFCDKRAKRKRTNCRHTTNTHTDSICPYANHTLPFLPHCHVCCVTSHRVGPMKPIFTKLQHLTKADAPQSREGIYLQDLDMATTVTTNYPYVYLLTIFARQHHSWIGTSDKHETCSALARQYLKSNNLSLPDLNTLK